MNRYCLFAIIAVVGFGLLAAFGSLAFLGSGGEGENPNGSGGVASTAGGTGVAGPLTGQVPALLAALFSEASAKTGTPSALLAAFSDEECKSVWTVPEATLKDWTSGVTNVDSRGCTNVHDGGVTGPMQFKPGTFNESRAVVEQLTGHAPASILNLRDAVYATGVKAFNDAGRPTTWGREDVIQAAKRYLGACDYSPGGKIVHYCDDIVRKYQIYGGTL